MWLPIYYSHRSIVTLTSTLTCRSNQAILKSCHYSHQSFSRIENELDQSHAFILCPEYPFISMEVIEGTDLIRSTSTNSCLSLEYWSRSYAECRRYKQRVDLLDISNDQIRMTLNLARHMWFLHTRRDALSHLISRKRSRQLFASHLYCYQGNTHPF
jgi:hypothetical protein